MATVTKVVRKLRRETIINRVKKMVDMREEIAKDLDSYHVKLMKGNDKTGINCYTVSLIPGVDCPNCKVCLYNGCYDIQNDCWRPSVQKTRAINSAIHKYDRERYWKEINVKIKGLFIEELRINVGGDLQDEDFGWVNGLGIENPNCDILFFTKNDNGINSWIDENGDFAPNVHPTISFWEGMDIKNPYNLPTAHILWADGRTTAKGITTKPCGGNCSECYYYKRINNKEKSGCWGMIKGDAVLFNAH